MKQGVYGMTEAKAHVHTINPPPLPPPSSLGKNVAIHQNLRQTLPHPDENRNMLKGSPVPSEQGTDRQSLGESLILRRVPMSFFHTTPAGRIINRLTKDTSDVDKNLADFASFFLRSGLQLFSTLVLIGVYVPFALAALVPILLCFYLLYAYFQVPPPPTPPQIWT